MDLSDGRQVTVGNLGQKRVNNEFGKLGIRTRLAISALHFDGVDLFNILDADGVVFGAEPRLAISVGRNP